MIEYKLSSAVLVFNSSDELALQLRASEDDSFPGHWDFSAGGGIDEGENHKDAAKRELFEELGVQTEPEFLTKMIFKYHAWNSQIQRESTVFMYKAKYGGVFNPDPKEVKDIQFFKITKIQEMIDNSSRFHPEFLQAFKMIKEL